jgi:hypothetical protein
MRIRLTLSALLLALPLVASAETFSIVRDIAISELPTPEPFSIELDRHAIENSEDRFRIVNSGDRAVFFDRYDESVDLLPQAIMDASPAAADTVPVTTLRDMLDGNWESGFQPATADTYVWRFHYAEPVAPASLTFDLVSGDVENVRVRIGNTAGSLKEAFSGQAYGSTVALSGERATHYEVTIRMRGGVLKIREMQLQAPRTRLVFRGATGQKYRLFYGGGSAVPIPEDPTFQEFLSGKGIVAATLSQPRAPRADELSDHDGIVAGDNCPVLWNPEQKDVDEDGVGNECDTCPSIPNADQSVGPCSDDDGDGVLNAKDNCPSEKNPAQSDEDQDGTGNACDDTDSRFTAGKPWLLWGSMAGIVVILAGLGVVIMKRSAK